MGRGLSQLQKDILTVAENNAEYLLATGAIIQKLGRDLADNNYSAVSKAIARLNHRKLLDAIQPDKRRPGGGYLYSLPPWELAKLEAKAAVTSNG